MKKKTIIIIVLFVLLYIAFIIFMRRVNSDEAEEYKGLMGKKRKYSVEVDYEKLVEENKDYILEMYKDAQLAVDLKMFKQGKEYLFGKIMWNTSVEQVASNVPYSLLEAPDRTQSSTGYTYYISEEEHNLYGQKAAATYEFYEDQLKQVQINFDSIEKKKRAKSVFDTIIENLCEICGQETEKTKDDARGYICYQWNAEDTILQVEWDDSCVVITVRLKEKP